MNKALMGLAGSLVFLLLASGVLAADTQQIICRGKMVDQAGKAVEGAEVVALARSYDPAIDTFTAAIVAKTVSAKGGTFELLIEKRADLWIIAAHKRGLAIGWEYMQPQGSSGLNITLGKGVTVRGSVDANPAVKDVQLQVILSRTDDDGRKLDLPTQDLGWLTSAPNEKGEFELADIPATGTYILVAKAPGRAPCISSSLAGRPWYLVLTPSTVLKGKLLGAYGAKPQAGMRVLVENEDRPSFVRPEVAITGKDGGFAVAGLDTGPYRIRVAADKNSVPEWATDTTRIILREGDSNDLTLRLIDGPLLEVILIDATTGLPVGGAEVHLNTMIDSVWYFKRFTSLDGRCRIRVSPREYKPLSVYKSGYSDSDSIDQDKIIDMKSGQDRSMQLHLTPLPLVRGLIRDAAGQPLAGAELYVIPGYRGYPPLTTDALGAFQLQVDPEEWRKTKPVFIARHEDKNLAIAMELPESMKVDVRLKPARTIKGQVVDTAGKPLADARVNLEFRSTHCSPSIGWSRTDKAGAYSISGIPESGDGRLVVDHDEYSPTFLNLNLGGDKKQCTVPDFTLDRRSSTVSGTVFGPDGKPLANVPVRSSIECVPGHWYESSVVTGLKGDFKLECLPKGRINLNVQMGERQLFGRAEANPGATGVEIRLSSGWGEGMIERQHN